MANSKLSNKALFQAYVPNFGANIPESAIQLHIDNYVRLTLKNILGAILVSDMESTVNNSGANKPELYAFWQNFVSMLVTYSAASKWIVFHGQNATQFGFSHIQGAEFGSLMPKDRAVMSEDLRENAASIQGETIAYLNSVHWTFDGVSYQNPSNQGIDQSADTGITSISPFPTFPRRGY